MLHLSLVLLQVNNIQWYKTSLHQFELINTSSYSVDQI